MADVHLPGNAGGNNAGSGRPNNSNASPDRSQSGRSSQASITPPSADNNNANNNNAADNAGERALAQAQMSTLGNNPNASLNANPRSTGRRRGDPAQDEAIMGVAESGAYEALDEGGEMVRVRFLDFLHTL